MALAKARKPLESYKEPEKLTWPVWREILGTWHFYVFPALFTCMGLAGQPSNSMGFWLKAYNARKPKSYTIPQINVVGLSRSLVGPHAETIVSDADLRCPGPLWLDDVLAER